MILVIDFVALIAKAQTKKLMNFKVKTLCFI